MRKRFIRDQTAEGYIDVAITMLIIFTLMASLMALFPLFTAQQSLNQTARYMARTVELYGKADDATLSSVTRTGISPFPTALKWKHVFDASQRTSTQNTVSRYFRQNSSLVILSTALEIRCD
jgi:Flp pilus assembly protein TadG